MTSICRSRSSRTSCKGRGPLRKWLETPVKAFFALCIFQSTCTNSFHRRKKNGKRSNSLWPQQETDWGARRERPRGRPSSKNVHARQLRGFTSARVATRRLDRRSSKTSDLLGSNRSTPGPPQMGQHLSQRIVAVGRSLSSRGKLRRCATHSETASCTSADMFGLFGRITPSA